MAKKKTVADQSRSGHVSSFTGGLNTDLHPMLQPNDTLTDCVNGTLITYNGNENMLQNDMGNYELKHAQLPEGYIPMGMKEHQGILYIASWNPFTKKAQIGSYPSPKTRFGEEYGNDYTVSPIEIGTIENIENLEDNALSELIFSIAEKTADNIDFSKHLVSELDFSSSEKIFTNDFDKSTMLGIGDRYWLSTDSDGVYDDVFQDFSYFLIDEDKNQYDITNDIVCNNIPKESPNIDDFVPVTFDHSGWLGAKYTLKDISIPDIDVTIIENPFTSENYITNISSDSSSSDSSSDGSLENLKELWHPSIPAYNIPNNVSSVDVKDTYKTLDIKTKDITGEEWYNKITDDNKYNVEGKYVLQLSEDYKTVLKIDLTDNYTGEVIIPEGIVEIKYKAFSTNINTLKLPQTISKIGYIKSSFKKRVSSNMSAIQPKTQSVGDKGAIPAFTKPNVENLIIKSNYRHPVDAFNFFTVDNVCVVPNNLYYYNRHKPLGSGTQYNNLYGWTQQDDPRDHHMFSIYLNSNSEYSLVKEIISSLDVPYIITPKGKNLNLPQCIIENNVAILSYNKLIDTVYVEDLPKNLNFTSARINTDCKITKEVISNGQTWTITKNTYIDLSNLVLGNTITLNVLGAETREDLERFVSTITFPNLETEGENTLTVTIYSSVGSISLDISKPGIKIVCEYGDFGEFEESNTFEFTPVGDWAYYNIIPSHTSEINTYRIELVGDPNTKSDAWKVVTESVGNILKDSILLVPTNSSVSPSEEDFKVIIKDGNNTDNINNLLGNVVLEGPETMSYYQYSWNLESLNDIGKFKINLHVVGTKSEFGIKVRTPLFKYEDGVLKVRNFYTSCHNVDKKEIPDSTPKANVLISTDNIPENCKIAVRCKYGSDTSKYYILDNSDLSINDSIIKSESYNIDSYVFKQSEDSRILIENLNAQTININKTSVANDLSIYRYGKYENDSKLKIQLEWPQAIDQSECYWTITDLEGNIVVQEEVFEEIFFDSISLDVDCTVLTDYWYVFSYFTPSTVYKRPLFAKTKIQFNGTSFNGPECADYINLYYEDLAEEEVAQMDYRTDDLPLIPSEMQIFHKKSGDNFTWDTQYSKESPKAFWWELMDKFDNNYKYYLGTRKYQTVTLDLEKFGFVKGVTQYSVELHADRYDKPQIIQESGTYDVENNVNVFTIPVGESIQQVESTNEKTFPFKKEYLIQNSYTPTEFDSSSILDAEEALKVSTICDWDKGKMLCVDKTSGETNDCSIALLDPKDYDPNSDSFKDGKIISGQGNFVSKILSKVNNLFVPIVVRIKTDDNGFVFPVVKNPNWSYNEDKWWSEARGKKNSDNKRSIWSVNGLGSVVHTKNNMAAIMSTLISGFALIAAAIAEYVAAIVIAAAGTIASVFTFGTSAVLGAMGSTALFAVAISQTVAGISLVSAGFAELNKKEKIVKLFALRGKSNKGGQSKDLLVLPLWGKQEEHDSRNFEGQIRYENVNWSVAEKLMLYLGSRIYAKMYSDERYIPKFVKDEINKGFKLVVNFKNIDIKSGGISLKSLEKLFKNNYKINTKNFTLKVSEISHVDIEFYKDGNVDIVNRWLDEDSYSSLKYQLDNWSDTIKTNVNQPIIDLGSGVDQKISNFANCLNFDPLTKCFYYDEIDAETWYEEDPRWAFGPNRGGYRMRIKRNFRKKNGKKSKDKGWIDVGEFPRFNNDVITPIAYPILPYCKDEYTESTKPNRSENIVNSYNKTPGENTPVHIETISLDISKPRDIITEDCMNYLEYIYYDKIKELQTTDSTN